MPWAPDPYFLPPLEPGDVRIEEQEAAWDRDEAEDRDLYHPTEGAMDE